MSKSNPLNAPPKIWHNGVLVEEKHLEASGNPPVEQSLSDEWQPMVIPDHYKALVDGFTAGIHQRRTPEGTLQVKAWAYCNTDHEELLESPVYTLVPEADLKPFDVLQATSYPVRELTGEANAERAARHGFVRATMGEHDKSPLDMVQLCREKQADARQRERVWQVAQDKLEEEKRLDAQAIELYRLWERGKRLVEKK